MLRNILIGLTALLVVASCKSASTASNGELTPMAITQVLQTSGQSNGADVAKALNANKPLLLVFWQSW
ncbi:MAG: hypothetical protein JKY61_03490 [Planctomycetes bacterium]|nr:hypothetical protein [Planctomycetota bacterium]